MSDVMRQIQKGLKDISKHEVNLLMPDINNYFRAIKCTMEFFLNGDVHGGVYISTTRPAKSIIGRLQSTNLNLNDVYFVDTVSYMSEGPVASSENIVFLESPTMLEMMITKTENMLSRVLSNEKFIFFDSINALAIYNDERILTEFMHVLINNLTAKKAYNVLLAVKGQTPSSLENLAKMVSDNIIEIRGD